MNPKSTSAHYRLLQVGVPLVEQPSWDTCTKIPPAADPMDGWRYLIGMVGGAVFAGALPLVVIFALMKNKQQEIEPGPIDSVVPHLSESNFWRVVGRHKHAMILFYGHTCPECSVRVALAAVSTYSAVPSSGILMGFRATCSGISSSAGYQDRQGGA